MEEGKRQGAWNNHEGGEGPLAGGEGLGVQPVLSTNEEDNLGGEEEGAVFVSRTGGRF